MNKKAMVSRKQIIFEESLPYHIVIRAIGDEKVFLKEEDCFRCLFQMYTANIGSPSFNLHRQDIIKAGKALLNGEEIPKKLIVIEHPPLVHNLGFSLVITHAHFELVPNVKNGIPKYLQKFKGGFAKYFNLKHNRKGNLFERPYKSVPIESNFQLDVVLRYINIINPLDVYQPGWRKIGIKNTKEAFRFLNEYQFSSFPDLFGTRKSKIIASEDILKMYLGEEIKESQTEFIKFTKDYLQGKLISHQLFFLE